MRQPYATIITTRGTPMSFSFFQTSVAHVLTLRPPTFEDCEEVAGILAGEGLGGLEVDPHATLPQMPGVVGAIVVHLTLRGIIAADLAWGAGRSPAGTIRTSVKPKSSIYESIPTADLIFGPLQGRIYTPTHTKPLG